MKYEVIKEYPGCGEFKVGREIEVIKTVKSCESNTLDYTVCLYNSNKSCVRLVNVTFHPAKYPEFFKPIEDKPKWIDEEVLVGIVDEKSGLRASTNIKLHKSDLYTYKDMIEFGAHIVGEYFDSISESDAIKNFEDWIEQKKQS